LFYLALDGRLLAVPIRIASTPETIEAGSPIPLFATRVGRALSYPYNQQYDFSPDGQRFLINTIIDEVPSPIRVILNWFLTRPLLLGNFVPGVFTPVLAKHSKNLSIIDALAIGIDRIQRNFEPLRRQVESWRSSQITDDEAKLVIYRVFIENHLDIPCHLARDVHKIYFEPTHQEFAPHTMWSLSNASTSALKSLDPTPFFPATTKLGTFLNSHN